MARIGKLYVPLAPVAGAEGCKKDVSHHVCPCVVAYIRELREKFNAAVDLLNKASGCLAKTNPPFDNQAEHLQAEQQIRSFLTEATADAVFIQWVEETEGGGK